MKIKILNQDTINKIAAGEVILRPASVVKELVENSIDAGASIIKVSILEGGKREIKITDNGIGINFDEIPLAFKRHATSKLNMLEDLDTLETMGFRGEALSSIASVANVSIITKSIEEELGSKSIFEDGELINRRVCSYEGGTEITVTDIFKTIPARYKFLKKDESEERHIRDILQKLALSHPNISFEYTTDTRRIFHTSGNGNLLDTARAIFGQSFSKHLYEFSTENLPMKVYGLIGDLDARRSYRDNQIFFINGRYVKSKELSKAYEEEWEGKLMKHQYPSGIIFIELPSKMLDVNVHPQKTEIRILNKSLITILFKQCLREALNSLNIIPETFEEEKNTEESFTFYPNNSYSYEEDSKVEKPIEIQKSKEYPKVETQESFIKKDFYQEPEIPKKESIENKILDEPIFEGNFEDDFELPDDLDYPSFDEEVYEPSKEIRSNEIKEPSIQKLNLLEKEFIGQVFNTYLILQDSKDLYFIDQHAAHEAILYETFSRAFKNQTQFESQILLLPDFVALTKDEIEDYQKVKENLNQFGFQSEIEGDKVKIYAVPLILNVVQPSNLIIPLMRYFAGKDESPEIGLQKIITASCKTAIKGGDALTSEEIQTLLANLSELDNPYTCPHGRPIIRKQSEHELEKLFKRIV